MIRYLLGTGDYLGDDCLDAFEEYATYDEASVEARRKASRGTTTTIYKAVPVATFEARVTVLEYVCED